MGVHRRTGEKRAVKIIDQRKYWNTSTLEQIEREVTILKQIQHPNIISVIEVFSSPRYLHLVLEL